ncbi:hypothetical protein PACTADRAFT_8 [Pachysolen tannophilus NRRL Y-2460]|uniref:Bromo domain-containing protein n=1 Tax=Pachysolen tannophilus NRRL Y-2460 TaxID=669874 RepID=A0A1E4U0G2_PACTA|nr:hypothetical protein PACTADRAFT_8 [Pachysolen tannophilus NRRL Y-2460]
MDHTLRFIDQLIADAGGQAQDLKDLKDFLLSTFSLVNNLRDDNNRLISKEFFKLPSKKLYPDYYQLIESPISFNEIKLKIINNKYTSAAEFLQDFKLMNKNARTYNDPSSDIVLDCDFVLNFIEDQVKQYLGETIEEEKNEVSAPIEKEETNTKLPKLTIKKKGKKRQQQEEQKPIVSSVDYSPQLKKIIDHLVNYRVPKKGKIAAVFMDEVDGELYPDYYVVIKKGMAFNTIYSNLAKDLYKNDIDSFYNDVNLIFQNAQTYNQEGSIIFEDSVILSNIFEEKFKAFKEENVHEENIDEESTGKPLKLKLKQNKLKIHLSTKQESRDASPPPRKGRGRKKKTSEPAIDIETQEDEKTEEEPAKVEIENETLVSKPEENEQTEDELEPKAITPLPEKEESPELSPDTVIGYKRAKINPPNPYFKNFTNLIKEITINTVKTSYSATKLQSSAVGKYFSSRYSTQDGVLNNLKQTFREYKFNSEPLANNYSLYIDNCNSVSIRTVLNPKKIGNQKYDDVLFINGEKLTASPSVISATDDDNDLGLYTSKFDVKLSPGLNSFEYVIRLGPVIEADKDGKLPPRHLTKPSNEDSYVIERCCVWVVVGQY